MDANDQYSSPITSAVGLEETTQPGSSQSREETSSFLPSQSDAKKDSDKSDEEDKFMHRLKIKQRWGWFISLCIQIAFLLGVCYVGNTIASYLPLPIPGNICSMALLLTLLLTGIIDAKKIAIASRFLLSYMSVFFIPAGVTILTCLPIIQNHIPQFILVCAITTVTVFLVTAVTVMLVSRVQRIVISKLAKRKSTKSHSFKLRVRED